MILTECQNDKKSLFFPHATAQLSSCHAVDRRNNGANEGNNSPLENYPVIFKRRVAYVIGILTVHLFELQSRGEILCHLFHCVSQAVPLFFAEKEGDENCKLQFGGGYSPQIK